jgi:hypothetical protein
MIRTTLVGAAVILTTSIALIAPANAEPWMTAPSCPSGNYVNPDDLNGACLPATTGNDYVALAISTSTGMMGWGTASTQDDANRVAVAQCVASSNSVCEAIAGTHHGCSAIAQDAGSGVVNGGIGSDPNSATADALRMLPNGQVVAVQCSQP